MSITEFQILEELKDIRDLLQQILNELKALTPHK